MRWSICSLLALAACSPPSAPSGTAPGSVLDDPSYRFCHVDGANAEEAKLWCGLLDELPPDRCPGLRATCAGAVSEDPVGCSPTGPAGEPNAVAGEPTRPPSSSSACGEPPNSDGLQSLMRWIAAISVAALVLLILRLVWVSFARWQAPPKADTKLLPEPSPELSLEGTDVPNAPSADLLDAAKRALADGRESEAVLLARGAVLRKLGEIGTLWLHRSRTDREYVRSVRSQAAVHAELREICAAAEAVRWKGSQIEAKKASSVLQSAERLFAALRIALTLLALSSGLASEEARAQGATSFDYERYAPSGDAALLDLFRRYGYDAGFRLTDLGALDERTDVLVLDTMQVRPTPEQWERIEGWVEAGGVLLLGGLAPPFDLGEIEPPSETLSLDPRLASDLPLPRWPPPLTTSFAGGKGWPLVSDGEGRAVIEVLEAGDGVVIAIADPVLLRNGSFVHPDNERFVGELLYAGQSRLGWPMGHPARLQLATRAAVSSEGGNKETNDMLGALATSGLLLFVIQLISTGALVALWRGWPFSPLREPTSASRHAFVEHVRALGTRYWRMQATAHAEQQLAALWLLRLGVSGLQLAAQRSGYTPEQARTWAREIEAIASSTDPDRRGDLGRMEELWRITRTAR